MSAKEEIEKAEVIQDPDLHLILVQGQEVTRVTTVEIVDENAKEVDLIQNRDQEAKMELMEVFFEL